MAVGIIGLSYAAVPLYQMFCQATGYGGTTQKATEEQFKNMKPVRYCTRLLGMQSAPGSILMRSHPIASSLAQHGG